MLNLRGRILDGTIAASVFLLGIAVYFDAQEARLVVTVLCVFCAVLWLHSRRLERKIAHFDELLTDVRFGEGTKRDRDAVDILVRAMETNDPGVRETALKTLRKITEQDFTGPRAILAGRYKLVVEGRRGSESAKELFDLRNDPAEEDNLIESNPDIAEKLELQLREWQESVLNSLTGADYR